MNEKFSNRILILHQKDKVKPWDKKFQNYFALLKNVGIQGLRR